MTKPMSKLLEARTGALDERPDRNYAVDLTCVRLGKAEAMERTWAPLDWDLQTGCSMTRTGYAVDTASNLDLAELALPTMTEFRATGSANDSEHFVEEALDFVTDTVGALPFNPVHDAVVDEIMRNSLQSMKSKKLGQG